MLSLAGVQEAERDAVEVADEPAVIAAAALLRQADTARATARAASLAPQHALPFLQVRPSWCFRGGTAAWHQTSLTSCLGHPY